MSDSTRHLLDDLEAMAALLPDPARRAEVRRIVARLSGRDGAWPDAAELMRLRLKCRGGPN